MTGTAEAMAEIVATLAPGPVCPRCAGTGTEAVALPELGEVTYRTAPTVCSRCAGTGTALVPDCPRCVELEAELAPWRAMERLRAAQLARAIERDAMNQTTTIHTHRPITARALRQWVPDNAEAAS